MRVRWIRLFLNQTRKNRALRRLLRKSQTKPSLRKMKLPHFNCTARTKAISTSRFVRMERCLMKKRRKSAKTFWMHSKNFPTFKGKGPAVRGSSHTKAFLENIMRKGVFVDSGFLSASKEKISPRCANRNCQFFIPSKTGKDIAKYSASVRKEGYEVLFAPGHTISCQIGHVQ